MPERSLTDAHEFTVTGADAAYSARAELDDLAADWLDRAVYAEARLLLSELVSAVIVQHGGPAPIDVRLSAVRERGLRAEVSLPLSDGRPPLRAFRLVAGHRAQILDALADRWGIVLNLGAPYAWFELGA